MLPEACTSGKSKKKALGFTILLVLFILTFFAAFVGVFLWLIISGKIEVLSDFVTEMGPWGNVILGIVMALQQIPPMVGYNLVVMLCGFLYGFWIGLVTGVVGAIVGWVVVFILVRTMFFEKAEKYVETSGGFLAKALMKELDKHQIPIALLIRLCPIPPGVQHSLLAVSPVTPLTFSWTTLVGMACKQVPFCFLGAQVMSVVALTQDGSSSSHAKTIISLILGVVGVGGLLLFGAFMSRKAMKAAKAMEEEEKKNSELSDMTDGEEGTETEKGLDWGEYSLDEETSLVGRIAYETTAML